jgi:serine/threonine protein kinase/HEAT repeat protein
VKVLRKIVAYQVDLRRHEISGLFPQLEILGLIGSGGMGAVYQARQRELNRIVALKILPPSIGERSGFAERFTREAQALAMLSHPGIVTIHDTGRVEGLYYLVMEYVDGVNLRKLIEHKRISPREALAIVPAICDALQYAHDAGIIHRDIKPENILLDRRGRVKVADFGLAKLVGASDSEIGQTDADQPFMTAVGHVMGTPKYMAPEQAKTPGDVDHRADIYSLGIVLYQMLTGELPGTPLSPPSQKAQINVQLDQLVLRAIEEDPALRYQHASQIKREVETIIALTDHDQKQTANLIMEIKFNCPSCHQPLSVDQSMAGTQVSCPSCAQPMVIPSSAPAPPIITPPRLNAPVHHASMSLPKSSGGKAVAIWALVLGIIGVIPVLGLATGLIALVLGIVALVKQTSKKGIAIAGTILGGVALLMIPIHLAVLLPMMAVMKFGAQTGVCASNVQTIATAIGEYRSRHSGSNPKNLEELVKEGLLKENVLVCPLHQGKGAQPSYEYIQAQGQSGNELILWDRVSHSVAGQTAGRTVIFANLKFSFLPENEFRVTPKAKSASGRVTPPAIATEVNQGKPRNPAHQNAGSQAPQVAPLRPVEKVMTIDSVLQDLKSTPPRDMRPLLQFLKDASPDERQRAAVIAATKPLLDDVDAGNIAFDVFLRWADNTQVPDFIELLKVAPKSPRGKEAMKFLSRSGDARAAEPLAVCLIDFFTVRDAKVALASLGEVAKPAVLPYYHHPERAAKEAARELLRGYNATEEETFAETLKALQNGPVGSRQSALFDLSTASLKPQQQEVASRALHPLVTDADRSISEGARKAMLLLATKADADFLLGTMSSSDERVHQFATDLLIKLKEPRVAKPLAMQLGDPRKTHAAGRALIALGSIAEPEVFPYLKNSELNTRKRAAEVLGEIGTKASLPELEKIARDKKQENFFARVAAERAIAAIKSRNPNGR